MSAGPGRVSGECRGTCVGNGLFLQHLALASAPSWQRMADTAATQLEQPDGTVVPAAEVLCTLCQRALPADTAGRSDARTGRFQCRGCQTLQTMLYRHVGPGALRDFDNKERQDFFTKCHTDCPAHGYEWQTVRSCLVSRMVTRHLCEQGQQAQTEALPLSVWLSRGWEEHVIRSCPSHCEESLCGTEVFSVPVRMEYWRDVHSRMSSGRAVQQKRGKAAAGDTPNGSVELEVGEAPLAHHMKGSGKARPKAAAGESADRKLVREKERTNKENQKTADLAAKTLAVVTPVLKSLPALQTQATKWRLSADLISGLEKAYEEAVEWRSKSTEARTSKEHRRAAEGLGLWA